MEFPLEPSKSKRCSYNPNLVSFKRFRIPSQKESTGGDRGEVCNAKQTQIFPLRNATISCRAGNNAFHAQPSRDSSAIFPFHLLPSLVHPTGFSFYISSQAS